MIELGESVRYRNQWHIGCCIRGLHNLGQCLNPVINTVSSVPMLYVLYYLIPCVSAKNKNILEARPSLIVCDLDRMI